MAPLDIWAQSVSLWQGLLYRALASLYFQGPAPFGWRGMAAADICASLSGTPSTFWEEHYAGCEELLLASFRSWQCVIDVVFVYGVLAVVCARLVRGLSAALNRRVYGKSEEQPLTLVLPPQRPPRCRSSPFSSRRRGRRWLRLAASSKSGT